MPWFHGRKMESLYRVRLPIKYHHQVCSTTKYHHFSPLKREIEVYLSLSRHDAFFQGSRPCRTPSPDDSSRQMARHSCGRVHRALGCPVSNNRLTQFGANNGWMGWSGAKNGWVLMTTMKCSVTTCKAHDQHEKTWKHHGLMQTRNGVFIGGLKPSKVRWTHGPGTP